MPQDLDKSNKRSASKSPDPHGKRARLGSDSDYDVLESDDQSTISAESPPVNYDVPSDLDEYDEAYLYSSSEDEREEEEIDDLMEYDAVTEVLRAIKEGQIYYDEEKRHYVSEKPEDDWESINVYRLDLWLRYFSKLKNALYNMDAIFKDIYDLEQAMNFDDLIEKINYYHKAQQDVAKNIASVAQALEEAVGKQGLEKDEEGGVLLLPKCLQPEAGKLDVSVADSPGTDVEGVEVSYQWYRLSGNPTPPIAGSL